MDSLILCECRCRTNHRYCVPGRTVDRIRSTALGTEIEITKPLDQSSPLLFTQACGGSAIPEVKIDVCRAATDGLVTYLQYVLSNVFLSEPQFGISVKELFEPNSLMADIFNGSMT